MNAPRPSTTEITTLTEKGLGKTHKAFEAHGHIILSCSGRAIGFALPAEPRAAKCVRCYPIEAA
jgi:hypothetical protein